jgi:D-alanine-D-alanine ligase
MGSSVGAARAENRDELNRAIDTGLAVDTSVLVEPLLVGQELTCGVLAREGSDVMDALPSILIEPIGHAFFDFESKYTPGHNRELCPAPISEELEQTLRKLALASHDALGCRDMSRTDFIVTTDGPIILEVNTLPGLTEASLIPKSAAAAQLSFDDLVDRLMQRAISRSA